MQRRQVQRLQRRAVNVQRLVVATCGEKANQNTWHVCTCTEHVRTVHAWRKFITAVIYLKYNGT